MLIGNENKIDGLIGVPCTALLLSPFGKAIRISCWNTPLFYSLNSTDWKMADDKKPETTSEKKEEKKQDEEEENEMV